MWFRVKMIVTSIRLDGRSIVCREDFLGSNWDSILQNNCCNAMVIVTRV